MPTLKVGDTLWARFSDPVRKRRITLSVDKVLPGYLVVQCVATRNADDRPLVGRQCMVQADRVLWDADWTPRIGRRRGAGRTGRPLTLTNPEGARWAHLPLSPTMNPTGTTTMISCRLRPAY